MDVFIFAKRQYLNESHDILKIPIIFLCKEIIIQRMKEKNNVFSLDNYSKDERKKNVF